MQNFGGGRGGEGGGRKQGVSWETCKRGINLPSLEVTVSFLDKDALKTGFFLLKKIETTRKCNSISKHLVFYR